MTTIVYRNGILAADTRAYSGDKSPIGEKQKIHQVVWSDGSIHSFGVSTANPGFSEEIARWFMNEKCHDYTPALDGRGFDALEVTGDGEVYFYKDSFTPAGPLVGEFWAIGSGGDYALGALAMGATAQEAVQIAGNNDPWTGGRVQHIFAVTQDEPVVEESAEAA